MASVVRILILFSRTKRLPGVAETGVPDEADDGTSLILRAIATLGAARAIPGLLSPGTENAASLAFANHFYFYQGKMRKIPVSWAMRLYFANRVDSSGMLISSLIRTSASLITS